jgi:hypothetical protein
MGMFGNSRRPVFKPSVYQPGRFSRRTPRWLMLLGVGILLGAGGLLFLQSNYAPPRLTAEQSEQLRSDVNSGTLERQRLTAQVSELQSKLAAEKAAPPSPADVAPFEQRIADLTQALQAFQEAVPPDPRGGDVGVRWGEFRLQGGNINYRALVTRENAVEPAMQGRLTIEISGSYRGTGKSGVVAPDPTPVALGQYARVQGTVAMPEGFTPRVVTVRVVDDQERQQAMRIYYVRGDGLPTPPAAGADAVPAAPPAPRARQAEPAPSSELRMTIRPAEPR